jgi:hypothetical protein
MKGMNKKKIYEIAFKRQLFPIRTSAPFIAMTIIKRHLNSTYIHGLLRAKTISGDSSIFRWEA